MLLRSASFRPSLLRIKPIATDLQGGTQPRYPELLMILIHKGVPHWSPLAMYAGNLRSQVAFTF